MSAFYDVDQLSAEQPGTTPIVGTAASVQVLAGGTAGDDPGPAGYRNGLLLSCPSTATTPAYIAFGSAAASAANAHIVLAPGQVYGMGVFGDGAGIWRGAVQFFGAATTSLCVAVV